MTTIDCQKLRASGALQLDHILEMNLQVGANRHGRAVLIGEAGEDAFEKLNGAVAGQEMRIWTLEDDGSEVPLFSGVIDTATLVSVGGYNRFQIELSSGTSLMDQQKRNRSFQNVSQTYEQIVEQVVSAYAGGFAICTIGCDVPIGTPLIQYGETDWEFLMRIASQLGGVLVPEVSRGLPRMWFGFPDRSYECTFPEHCYTSGLSQQFFKNGGEAIGLRREDYFYYDVESPENCDIGWYTYFKGNMFLISEKSAILRKSELLFTYRLGRNGLGCCAPQFNDKISGMSLLGEVVSTSAETVSLRLDIDKGHDPGGAYPYPWRPATGNLMYCMPQVGTRVSLYFPTVEERNAHVVNCVRTNGDSCDRMNDTSKRAFVTEHGKELTFYPEEMSLVGGVGQLMMSDANGIRLNSNGFIQIVGASVHFEAPTITCAAPKGELIIAKTDAKLQEAESAFSMSNAYQLLSESDTNIEGSDLETFDPYEDQPEAGSFDWFALAAAVVGAVVAIVVVTALSLTGVGAFVVGGVIAGAIVGGALAGRDAYNAGARGGELLMAILQGADTGARIGAIGGLVSFAVFSAGAAIAGAAGFSGLGLGGTMLCGGTSSAIMSAGTQYVFTGKVDWDRVARDGFTSAAFSGLFYGITNFRFERGTNNYGGKYTSLYDKSTGNGVGYSKTDGNIHVGIRFGSRSFYYTNIKGGLVPPSSSTYQYSGAMSPQGPLFLPNGLAPAVLPNGLVPFLIKPPGIIGVLPPAPQPPAPQPPVAPNTPLIDLSQLPQNVQNAFNKYENSGWSGNVPGQTPGTKAGGKYGNRDKLLPVADADGNPITYQEWDVNNKHGPTRDSERFVTGSDGSVYYTDSHYGDGPSPCGYPPFIKIK